MKKDEYKRVGWVLTRQFKHNGKFWPFAWAMAATSRDAIAMYDKNLGEGMYNLHRYTYNLKTVPVFVKIDDLKPKENQ